jgi:hypothetical protein
MLGRLSLFRSRSLYILANHIAETWFVWYWYWHQSKLTNQIILILLQRGYGFSGPDILLFLIGDFYLHQDRFSVGKSAADRENWQPSLLVPYITLWSRCYLGTWEPGGDISPPPPIGEVRFKQIGNRFISKQHGIYQLLLFPGFGCIFDWFCLITPFVCEICLLN